ncbi:MAG: phage terminase large subunit, partial [Butyrivibrio sp.]|nr:phage terminase large subunit [Butyrivibrio sp.]
MTYQGAKMEIRLSNLIAPQFYDIHWDIIEGKHTHYKLYGGRGSTKSSFISLEIIMGMMEDPEANAACFRRIGNTLQESVFEQLMWAIDALGVAHLWKANLSPLRITYIPT